MSLLTAGQLAQDGEFILRVKIAMVTAAKDTAAAEETNFMAYEKLHSFAVQILNDPNYKVNAFSFACASNQQVEKGSQDGDIQFTVNSVFKSMAGVKPSDETTEIATA